MELKCPLKIDKSEVCEHLIYVKRCWECQIKTFLESRPHISRDVMNNVLTPMIQTESVRIMSFTRTYVEDDDGWSGSEEELPEGYCNFLRHDLEHPQLRIVCEGSEEMHLGFAAGIYATYAYLDGGFMDANGMDDLHQRMFFDEDCEHLFAEQPGVVAFLELNFREDGLTFVAIKNILDFVTGFRKGCKISIGGVKGKFQAYPEIHILEGFDPMIPGAMIPREDGTVFFKVSDDTFPDTCHAYWYLV